MKPSELRKALEVCIKAQQPVCVWGEPGLGKSQIHQQIADGMGVELRDFRAVLHDSTDLTGVPYVQDGNTKWAVPSFLPKSGEGILFLDELNRAPVLVQNACFQLVHDRKVGDYTLPKGWAVSAACNPSGGGTSKMPDALRNRFIHLNVEANLDDWCTWANRKNSTIEPIVVAFLRFRQELLHKYSASENAFPTPRSWEFVSRITAASPGNGIELSLFEGAVGKGAAAEYMSFLKLYKELPSIDAILLNPDNAPVPQQPATLYAVSSALARRATNSNLARVIRYINRLPQEYAVCCIKDAAQRDEAITKTEDFIKWASDHQEVFS